MGPFEPTGLHPDAASRLASPSMSGPDTSHCWRALAVVLVVFLAACGGSGEPERATAGEPSTEQPTTTPPSAPAPPTTPCAPAPLEVRAATVLAVGIGNATTAEHPLAAEVASLGLGGVVLVKHNVVEATQVRALVEGLRRQSPRPLLVSVDEEGGGCRACDPSSVPRRRHGSWGAGRRPRSAPSPPSEGRRCGTSGST